MRLTSLITDIRFLSDHYNSISHELDHDQLAPLILHLNLKVLEMAHLDEDEYVVAPFAYRDFCRILHGSDEIPLAAGIEAADIQAAVTIVYEAVSEEIPRGRHSSCDGLLESFAR